MTSITIPKSVTSIGVEVFESCYNMENIFCKAVTPPSCENYPFPIYESLKKIYVPSTSVDAYKTAEYWKVYADYDLIVGYDFE